MKTVTVTLDLSERAMGHLISIKEFYGVTLGEAVAIAASFAVNMGVDQVEGGAS